MELTKINTTNYYTIVLNKSGFTENSKLSFHQFFIPSTYTNKY